MILQNIIYESKLKVLIYELDIKKYISVVEFKIFNIPIKLTFEQRKRYINYIKKENKRNNNIEIKLINEDFEKIFKDIQGTSIYLSKK